MDEDALVLIARQATGSMRDAQSLLDQLSSMGTTITLELAQTVLGTATSQTVLAVIGSIRERKPAGGLDAIHRALDSGADPRTLARQIVEYLRDLMLIQMGNPDQVETTKDLKARMAEDARVIPTGEILRIMKGFNEAAADTRGGWQPSLSLEVALASAFEAPAASAAAASGGPGGSAGTGAARSTPGAQGNPGRPPKPEVKSQQAAASHQGESMLYQDAGPESCAGSETGHWHR